jgi:hypothetical protein
MRRATLLSAMALLLAMAAALISRDPVADARLKKASRAAERSGWIQIHLEGRPRRSASSTDFCWQRRSLTISRQSRPS